MRAAARVAIALFLVPSCARAPDGLIWEHRTWRPAVLAGDSQMFTPVLAGEIVIYCGGYAWNRQSHLAAASVTDGRMRWEHAVGSCGSSPLILDSIAIGFGRQGTDSVLTAAATDTGRLLWTVRLPPAPQYRSYSMPIAHRGSVYLHDGAILLRVEARSGAMDRLVIPGCDRESDRTAWLAANAERALLGCGESVYSLEPDAPPHLVATLAQPNLRVGYATIAGTILYVIDFDRQSTRLAAFALEDSRLLWKQELPPQALSAPRPADGNVYIMVARPWALLSINARAGGERWRRPLRSFEVPLPAGRFVYSTDYDAVVLLDAQSGGEIHRWSSAAEVSTTPLLVGDTLLYGNLNGVLYAVKVPERLRQ